MLIDETSGNPRPAQSETAAESPLVVISILNWNGWQDTLECLESVRRLDYPNYLTVVVDNGSWNGSADKIKAWAEENLGTGHFIADYTRETALAGGDAATEGALDREPSADRIVLIRNEENLGFTGGNNVSIHYGLRRGREANFVMLLNNDAKVAHDCLGQLVAVARGAGAGIVSAVITLESSGEARSRAPFESATRALFLFLPFVTRASTDLPQDADFMWVPSSHGGAVLISSRVLRDVFQSRAEYLNSRLFMYGDEWDLHFHATRHGHKAALAVRAFAYHKGAGSSTGNILRVCYYRERNRILSANQVLPFHLSALYHALNIPRLALRIAKWTAQGDLPMAKTILSGQVDGYRGVGGKWKHHDEPHPFGHVGQQPSRRSAPEAGRRKSRGTEPHA